MAVTSSFFASSGSPSSSWTSPPPSFAGLLRCSVSATRSATSAASRRCHSSTSSSLRSLRITVWDPSFPEVRSSPRVGPPQLRSGGPPSGGLLPRHCLDAAFGRRVVGKGLRPGLRPPPIWLRQTTSRWPSIALASLDVAFGHGGLRPQARAIHSALNGLRPKPHRIALNVLMARSRSLNGLRPKIFHSPLTCWLRQFYTFS